jgi:hypothetical protein
MRDDQSVAGAWMQVTKQSVGWGGPACLPLPAAMHVHRCMSVTSSLVLCNVFSVVPALVLVVLLACTLSATASPLKESVDIFSEAPITQKNQRRYSLVRRGRSAVWGRTVRDLEQGSGPLPDDRTVRALGPDGPRVRRGGGRSPAAPGSRSREGPRRGGEILGVV